MLRAWREEWAALLAQTPLVRLLQERALGQVGQNALLYTLLLVVVERTGSSFFTALMVMALTGPSILFGLAGGALADALPLRWSLVGGALARVAIVALMVPNAGDLPTLFLLGFLFALVGQVVGPAESAALPRLVEAPRLARANALFILVAMLGQLGGAVVLAPFLFKLLGARAVMVVVSLLYVRTAVVAARIGPLGRGEAVGEQGLGLWEALLMGWRVLRDSHPAFLAMVFMTAAMMLMKVVAVLAPHYVREVLDIEAENVVFVMAPAAVGAGLALLLTPLLGRLIKIDRAVGVGFAILVVGLMALGLVVQLRDFILEHLDLGIGFVEGRLGVSSVITLTLLLAVPVGLAGTMVLVAARTVLNREAPLQAQARVFATQSAVADAVSLLPALLLGGLADLVGARFVLVAATLATVAAVAYVLNRGPALMGRLRPQAL